MRISSKLTSRGEAEMKEVSIHPKFTGWDELKEEVTIEISCCLTDAPPYKYLKGEIVMSSLEAFGLINDLQEAVLQDYKHFHRKKP